MRKSLVARRRVSGTRQVDANRVWAIDDPTVPADAWWGIEAWVIEGWIAEALRKGDYRMAGLWSALLTDTAPVLPGGSVVRALDTLPPTPQRGPFSVLCYWATGDDYWVDTTTREIRRWARQGFMPGLRVCEDR